MYSFKYAKATTEEDLKTQLQDFFKDDNAPKLLEIFTPSKLNDEVLLQYFPFVK